MARAGQVTVNFNRRYFDQLLKRSGVVGLTEEAAKKVLDKAVASAPVDSGDYQRQLDIERKDTPHRTVVRVVSRDAKTFLVESKTQNLLRALRSAHK